MNSRSFKWIKKKIKEDLSLVWAVQDVILAPPSARKNAQKPLHRSARFVQGTARNNWIPVWILEQACCKNFGVDPCDIQDFEDPMVVLHLVPFSIRACEGHRVRELGMLPATCIEWLFQASREMLPILSQISFEGVTKIDWVRKVGAYLLVKAPGQDLYQFVMHNRSMKVMPLDRPYWRNDDSIDKGHCFISNNWFEGKATLDLKGWCNSLKLFAMFSDMVQVMMMIIIIIIIMKPLMMMMLMMMPLTNIMIMLMFTMMMMIIMNMIMIMLMIMVMMMISTIDAKASWLAALSAVSLSSFLLLVTWRWRLLQICLQTSFKERATKKQSWRAQARNPELRWLNVPRIPSKRHRKRFSVWTCRQRLSTWTCRMRCQRMMEACA